MSKKLENCDEKFGEFWENILHFYVKYAKIISITWERRYKKSQYIGKIDVKLFYKISDKILTDEVILTQKQKEHMEKRHPGILQKYEKCFAEIIEKPDYILKDNTRENTALILKTLYDRVGKLLGTVNLVLRLAVEGDSEENKNSIITCIPIGKSRLKSYKNNGKIVYKNE